MLANKKIVLVLIIIVAVLFAYFFIYMQPAPKKEDTKKPSFEVLAAKAYGLLKENGLAFEDITEDKLLDLDEKKVEDVKKALEDFKANNTENKAIVELVDIYIRLLDEILLRKELKQLEYDTEQLTDEGLCRNMDLLDRYAEKNNALYTAIQENNAAIESYTKKYPEENAILMLNKYLEDEDIAFINYYELQSYILDIQTECLGGTE